MPSPKNLKDGVYTAMSERDLRMGGMQQSTAMEYGSRKASSDVLKPRNIYIYILYIYMAISWNFIYTVYMYIKFQLIAQAPKENPCINGTYH
jgi:hypothetical protein